MNHAVYRVIRFDKIGPFTLRVEFDDGTVQNIDFRPVLEGTLYGLLQDEKLFDQVEIDPEIHTLVWSNGADFDPETLHDWPKHVEEMKHLAKRWKSTTTKVM